VLHQRDSPVFLLSGASALTVKSITELPRGVLIDAGVYYLVDALNPGVIAAKTLLVTSPRLDLYKDFKNRIGTTRVWMPVWDVQEIESCRARCYSGQAVDKVLERFQRWGGIPRFVLEKFDTDSQNELDEAIARTNVKQLKRFVGRIDGPDELSHKIIHIDVAPDFSKQGIIFASCYVEQKIVVMLQEQFKEKLVSFMKASEGIGIYGALRALLFEPIAHNILQRGGTFNCRPVGEAKVEKIQLPPTNLCLVNQMDQLKQLKKDQYSRPISKTWAAVDSWIVPDKFFQMTTATSHPIAAKHLDDMLQQLHLQEENRIRLYFVVPAEHFQSFTEQRYEVKKKNSTVLCTQEELPNTCKFVGHYVEQYVLELPIS